MLPLVPTQPVDLSHLTRTPDSEVAPLILTMKERTACEILAALPPVRAVALTHYLRPYQPPDTPMRQNPL